MHAPEVFVTTCRCLYSLALTHEGGGRTSRSGFQLRCPLCFVYQPGDRWEALVVSALFPRRRLRCRLSTWSGIQGQRTRMWSGRWWIDGLNASRWLFYWGPQDMWGTEHAHICTCQVLDLAALDARLRAVSYVQVDPGGGVRAVFTVVSGLCICVLLAIIT